MTILIYSNSSGNPGAEEESESKEDQQKVSVLFFVVPQTFCVIRIFLLVLYIAAPVCMSKTGNGDCGGTLTCVPLRFYVRMMQGPLHACLPSAFILVHA